MSESIVFRESDPTDDEDGDILELSHEMSAPTESVTLQIDAALDPLIWNGTTFEDRTTHLVSTTARDMVTQMERSLMQQESYDEFSRRMMKQMGIEDMSAKGVLRDMINQLKMEGSVAWNEAMISANQQDDTVLVWSAILDDRTTPTCVDNHGKLIDDIGETPPEHWGCRCSILTNANPDSTDEAWAAEGQSILDEMEAEKAGYA